MKVANAKGGGDLPQLVSQVGANGSLGVGPGQAAPKQAADAYAVANQAKLKMGTFLLELCGEPVPAGYTTVRIRAWCLASLALRRWG